MMTSNLNPAFLPSWARFLTKSPQKLFDTLQREMQLVQTLHLEATSSDAILINLQKKKLRYSQESLHKDQDSQNTTMLANVSETEQTVLGVENKFTGEKIRGERRLIINFESFGRRGEQPQTFGREGNTLIPDGLSGYHTVYQERWRFEVNHCRSNDEQDNITRITWTVQNVNSRAITSRTETRDEALSRMTLGRSITNDVFREAMRKRANELEQVLHSEPNDTQKANLMSMIKILRPKRFTQGPLVFGLQHQIVQEKMSQ